MKIRSLICTRTMAAAALALGVATSLPNAAADSNNICAKGDTANCILAGNFPAALTQLTGSDVALSASVRYIDGDWYIAGHSLGTLGTSDWTPVVGDWDGDGFDSPGLFKDGIWILKAGWDFSANFDLTGYNYGDGTWLPIVGDWNNDTKDSLGLYKHGSFKIQHISGDASSERFIRFGNLPYDDTDYLSAKPVAGQFDGQITTVGIIQGTTAVRTTHNESATYNFPAGDYTGLVVGTITNRVPQFLPIVYDGPHPTNSANQNSMVLFNQTVSSKDICPDTQLCIWVDVGGITTPGDGGNTEIPDPVVW